METSEIIGYIMICFGGALLHDVPFIRFIFAFLLISLGTRLI